MTTTLNTPKGYEWELQKGRKRTSHPTFKICLDSSVLRGRYSYQSGNSASSLPTRIWMALTHRPAKVGQGQPCCGDVVNEILFWRLVLREDMDMNVFVEQQQEKLVRTGLLLSFLIWIKFGYFCAPKIRATTCFSEYSIMTCIKIEVYLALHNWKVAKTLWKINLTFQSQKPPNLKVVLEW